MRKFLILVLITLLLIVSLVNAKVQSQNPQFITDGLIIQYLPIDTVKVNTPHEFNFHVFNQSVGKYVISGITCVFHVYNQTGDHIAILQVDTPVNVLDYSFVIDEHNFTSTGEYSYVINCVETASQNYLFGGYATDTLKVIPSFDNLTISESVFYSLLILVSIMVLFGILFLAFSLDGNNEYDIGGELLKVNYKKYAKIGLYLLAYQVAVFVSYAVLNVAQTFLYSDVLLKFFEVIFWVLLIGEIPFFLITVYFTLLKWFLDLKLWELNERGLKER